MISNQPAQSKFRPLVKSGLLEKLPTSKPQNTSKAKGKGKKAVQPKPVVLERMFAKYFFNLSYKKFVQLTEDWNEANLELKIEPQANYDAWLNYFKTIPINKLKMLSDTGMDTLSAEAYAALSLWRDIMINPSRIKNIHRAGLTSGKSDKTIVDFAKANDRLGVLEAIRDQLAEKLQQGAGARDAGQLSAQMMEVMTQIDIQQRKLAPKAETALGSLLSDMPEIKRKRPSKNGGGARHTSFASRVTIKDVEK